MFYAYVLQSQQNGRLYKGSCSDLPVRLNRHNNGYVRSTKPYRPWRLIYSENFTTRAEAFRREQFWKTATGARQLKKLLSGTGLSSEP
ncbi:MAG: GIY-YIG nuclease family protein [Kiritimatiellae bacterium]|nr:GIY-YIG nuclease family protein [Kiritimatiellia bacterium]